MTNAINTVHVPCATCDTCAPAPTLSVIGECIDCDFERVQANATGGTPAPTKALVGLAAMANDRRDALDDAVVALTAALELSPLGCNAATAVRRALVEVATAQSLTTV